MENRLHPRTSVSVKQNNDLFDQQECSDRKHKVHQVTSVFCFNWVTVTMTSAGSVCSKVAAKFEYFTNSLQRDILFLKFAANEFRLDLNPCFSIQGIKILSAAVDCI